MQAQGQAAGPVGNGRAEDFALKPHVDQALERLRPQTRPEQAAIYRGHDSVHATGCSEERIPMGGSEARGREARDGKGASRGQGDSGPSEGS